MATEQTNQDATNEKNNSTNDSKKNIFQKHPLVFILLGALIITFFYGNIKSNRIERKLTKEFTTQIEEIKQTSSEQLVHYFSLAIRSEWTRNNKEQATQYLIELLRDDRIAKIMFIEHPTHKVLFSSNKKDENKTIEDEFIIGTKNTHSTFENEERIVASPVMGLNNQIGILVVYFKS